MRKCGLDQERTGKGRSNRNVLAVILALLLLLAAGGGFAEGYPESDHPYAANSDARWTYVHPHQAYALKITFSEDTELESGYDFLYVIGEDGTEQKFSGTELQGKSVCVFGDSFTLRLTSDSSVNWNGFTVTSVEAVTQEDYEEYVATPRYTINASGVITAYSGIGAELVVPAEIDGVAVTGIGSSVFRENTTLKSVVLPEGVMSIGGYAFYGCSNLESVDLPAGITSIGNYAFCGCRSLTEMILPGSIETIGSYVFSGCSSLEAVTLSEGLRDSGSYLFYNCVNLSDVVLPRSLESIGSCMFYGCSSLTEIDLPEGLTSIGSYAFHACEGLTEITLPDGLTSIGTEAFPINTVLRFGDSDVIREYAIDNGLQYVSDSGSSLRDPIDTLEEKTEWIVDTYIDSGMSEYEIAKTLYDWIVAHVSYDYDYLDTRIPTSEYGVGGEAAIMDGWAVCHGYAQSFEWLLEEAGMEAKYVTGYDHAWNLVRIDGDWYHFDATWDDTGGGGRYDYFGLSDMAIHTETVNHGTQDSYRHVTCDSWEANYHYKNGYLDNALNILRSSIDESIVAGTYSGTVNLNYSDRPSGRYSRYTIALILNQDTEWAVPGRIEITPKNDTEYGFVFYPDEEPVTDILVEGISDDGPEYYEMYIGYAARMNVSTLPAGREVAFSSSNESVVTVSKDGLVTAVGVGEAYITLTAGNFSREFSIYVKTTSWPLSSTYYLDLGETKQCELYAYYDWFLTDNADVWTSSDEAVVTVDHNGMLTGVGYGKATVTLTTGAGVTDDMTVYVRKPVTAVVFGQTAYEIYEGVEANITLTAEGCDQDFYRQNFTYFTYTSSDESIADVRGYYSPGWDEAQGRWVYRPWIDILAPGEVTLTATARDGSGVSGSCKIIVKEAPKLAGMSFEQDTYEAIEGQPTEIVLRTTADDPDFYKENYGSFTYTSSDNTIATYYTTYSPVWNEKEGCWEYTVRVGCLAPGEATFTAAAKDRSGLTASCTIVVAEGPKLTSMAFESETYEGYVDSSQTLSLYTFGEDTDFYKEIYGSFTYTVSDPAVATIFGSYMPSWNEEAGCWVYRPIVDLLSPGETTLTATAQDGSGVSASCTIVVTEEPKLTGLSFTQERYEVMEGESTYLVLRTEADDPDYYKTNYGWFTYTSSDKAIANYGYTSSVVTWNEKESCWE